MANLRAMFGIKEVAKVFDNFAKEQDEKDLKVLQYAGENFVNNARSNDTYNDQTGNLRSSIGYIILNNGRVVHQNFKLSRSGDDRESGKVEAMNYASELASKYPQGWVLIGFAGMNYAAAVESRGYDVITDAANQVDIKSYFNNDISI